MILEVAILNIKEGLSQEFEKTFVTAQDIISSMKGYVSHQLKSVLKRIINIFISELGNDRRS